MNTSELNIKNTSASAKITRGPSGPGHRLLSAALAALGLLACTGSGRAACIWFPPATTVTISGTVITDCVDVDGRIVITGTGTLILNGNNGNDTSTIVGRIELSASGATLRIATNDHTFSGTGCIDGQDNGAKIEIATSTTLTSTTTIEGNCQILPVLDATSTTFINSGTVHANNPGTLDLAVHSLGSPSGAWRVSTSASAILEFSVGSTTMTGRFDVDAGKVTVEDNVDTNGVLDFQGGTIDVASGAYFKASQP